MEQDEKIRKRFSQEASFSHEPILLRGPDEKGFYRVLDGMHRFVGAAIEKRKTVTAYVPINENDHLRIVFDFS